MRREKYSNDEWDALQGENWDDVGAMKFVQLDGAIIII